MRVHVVDPAAYTPPYDHALCSALGRAGAEVTLVTSRFAYGEVPPADAYERRELFYRAAFGAPSSRLRTAVKLAEHVPDMLGYRHVAREADVAHFQWLSVQHVDAHLLPAHKPLLITAHDILPREPRPGQLRAQRRLYERFDAIVVHSERGRTRLTGELGVEAARVHVIPHGVIALPSLPSRAPQSPAPASSPPPALPPSRTPPQPSSSSFLPLPSLLSPRDGRPVVLMFGLLRPYKGLDLLLEAWQDIEDAELWVVGMPRYDISPLRRAAPANVKFVTRFVSDAEMAAWLQRADLVVLPYREADQSGVALTALGASVPLLLSDVGGFPELAATGAARTFAAGDATALHAAIAALLADPTARAAMSESARAAAEGPYSWETIARRTLGLYQSLLKGSPDR